MSVKKQNFLPKSGLSDRELHVFLSTLFFRDANELLATRVVERAMGGKEKDGRILVERARRKNLVATTLLNLAVEGVTFE